MARAFKSLRDRRKDARAATAATPKTEWLTRGDAVDQGLKRSRAKLLALAKVGKLSEAEQQSINEICGELDAMAPALRFLFAELARNAPAG